MVQDPNITRVEHVGEITPIETISIKGKRKKKQTISAIDPKLANKL